MPRPSGECRIPSCPGAATARRADPRLPSSGPCRERSRWSGSPDARADAAAGRAPRTGRRSAPGVHEASGLTFTRPSPSGSIAGSLPRSPPWKRLRPVIHAAKGASPRASGSTFRSAQQRSGSKYQSSRSGSSAASPRRLRPDHAKIGQAEPAPRGPASSAGSLRRAARCRARARASPGRSAPRGSISTANSMPNDDTSAMRPGNTSRIERAQQVRAVEVAVAPLQAPASAWSSKITHNRTPRRSSTSTTWSAIAAGSAPSVRR